MNHTLHSAALKKYSYKACDIRTLLGNHCTGTVIIFIRLSQMICCVFLLSNEDIVLELLHCLYTQLYISLSRMIFGVLMCKIFKGPDLIL